MNATAKSDAPPVIVVGAGRWGINLVRTLYKLGALASVVDEDRERLAIVKQAFPEIGTFTSLGDGLRGAAPAVAVATPAQTHHDVALAALQAGKDVFVEKPLTLLPSQARSLRAAAAEGGRVLMVGHMLLYQPAIQFVKKFLEEGTLGQPYFMHQVRRNLGTVRKHENVLFSFGVHDLAVLQFLTGRRPVGLRAVGQCCITPGVEDEASIHLTYDTGLRAHLELSWLWPEKERKLTIACERGFLVYDELTHQVRAYDAFADASGRIENRGVRTLFEGAAEPLELEMLHFLDCIANRSVPLSGGDHGTDVVSTLHDIAHILESRERA